MTQPKIGLLPLYIEIYDQSVPEARPRIDEFYGNIAAQLGKRGLEVVTVPVCRLENEFRQAIKTFEDAGCGLIVTLHLAYSPSLESAKALLATKLPIVVLDTTPTYNYSPQQDPMEVMFNHGIHGVQDMCNVLIRNGKEFRIEAGHWEKSDVLDRVAGWAKASVIAARMKSARVGIIGSPFKGMGDFAVPAAEMKKAIGIETVPADPAALRSLVPASDDPETLEELNSDASIFLSNGLDPQRRLETARACVAVRRWIEQEQLTGFTMNFLEIDQACGLPSVPFLEASKAMARGIGYAGEGDVLTAALVGALASVHPDTTFAEMFCPDWAGNTIFIEHMGEMNINLTMGKPSLREMDFPWTDAETPIIAVGRFRGGDAVLVNLAPGPDNTYSLILAPVEMLSIKGKDNMSDLVHGWFRPEMPVQQFLEEYSRAGGTHHLALVYGDVIESIAGFGDIMGWCVRLIGRGGG